MGIKRRLADATATLLLACAGCAAVAGVAVTGLMIVSGVSGFRFTVTLVAFGLTVVTGTVGYVVRKAVAGQLLDLDHRTPPVFRGGQ